MTKLTNKRALITGATGDIGKAIVRELHYTGCEIFLSSTKDIELRKLSKELGKRVNFLPINLTGTKNAQLLINEAIETMGSVDILVNNAGITQDTLFMRMSDEQWNSVLDVNLNSSMALARGAIKNMIKNKWGRIINITSVVGVTGNPGQANYAASKAALIGMSKSIAKEVASRGITVNCIAPGFISSAMTQKLTEEQQSKILMNIPMNRMGEPKDVAETVLFLSSNSANYITGQTLHVNGGLAMF